MNMKKIMGAFCALACAVNFGMITPAYAGILGIMNAHQQEKWAEHLAKEEFNGTVPDECDSDEAKRIAPTIHKLQKRVCDANGIEITDQKFQHTYDFKDKMHPIKIINGYHNGYAVGAGYIYLGTDVFSDNTFDFNNQYDYILCENTIAHEITHNIEGHTIKSGRKEKKETNAEKGSIQLLENLPEGGWGSYLVSVHRDMNYPEINRKIMGSFEKESNGKITIVNNGSLVVYRSKTGENYNLAVKNHTSDDSAYYGGQMAYVIAKGALTVDNIGIMENTLKDAINFKGDYLLVCYSDKLPNGYRILTELYGDKQQINRQIESAKQLLADNVKIGYYNDVAEKTILDKTNPNENYWKIWLTCAVAEDLNK